MKPFFWMGYSQKLIERILNPRNIGAFREDELAFQDMRVVIGEETERNNHLRFSIVVDTTDGRIADVKFVAFGKTSLIGAADVACEILLRKTIIQARQLSGDLIDQKLRDSPHIPPFPQEACSDINLILSAIEAAFEQCADLPVMTPISTPSLEDSGEKEEGHPHWHLLSPEEKLDQIEAIIEAEIQPSIALDAGGIRVVGFHKEQEVVIAYEGACITCPASTGATLEAIQSILRSRLSSSLYVRADPSFLNLEENDF